MPQSCHFGRDFAAVRVYVRFRECGGAAFVAGDLPLWADLDYTCEPSEVGDDRSEPPEAMATQDQAKRFSPPRVRPPCETKGKPS